MILEKKTSALTSFQKLKYGQKAKNLHFYPFFPFIRKGQSLATFKNIHFVIVFHHQVSFSIHQSGCKFGNENEALHWKVSGISERKLWLNCPLRSWNGDKGRVFKFSFNHKLEKDHIKISQFTKFEVLSLDCNHVENFQKSGKKIETVYGFGGRHLRIREICMEFGRPLTGHSLVTTQ